MDREIIAFYRRTSFQETDSDPGTNIFPNNITLTLQGDYFTRSLSFYFQHCLSQLSTDGFFLFH